MPHSLVEDAAGDPRNATFLAIASDLSYLAGAEANAAFRDQLGMESAFIAVGNSQAYLLSNDQHLAVAFRGTENPATLEGLKDWLLTDAMNLLILPTGRLGTDLAAAGVGARFHQGFVDALADIWEPVHQAVAKELEKQDRPLWITGHSLGGSLALLAAWMFLRRTINVHQVYTFGAPMIGNADAMKAFERELDGKVFRYVDHIDMIPKLPTVSLLANAYEHCPAEKPLGVIPKAANVAGSLDVLRQFASKAADGLLKGTLIDEVWNTVISRVNAHMMTNYREKINE
jgi:hypothetical protein